MYRNIRTMIFCTNLTKKNNSTMATNYRLLTPTEIAQLEKQLCVADSWENIQVAENFTPTHIHYTRFPVPSVWEYLKKSSSYRGE